MGKFAMSKSFKEYLECLTSLDPMNTLAKKEKVIIFISGSSHFAHSELSKNQLSFFEESMGDSIEWLATNFPYNELFRCKDPKFPSLLQASWSNCLYFIHTRWNKRFQHELIRHLTPIFQCKEIVIISQSSGLNMLTTVLSQIKHSYQKIQIIALGPVSIKKLDKTMYDCFIIKGKHDWYSRLFDRNQPDYLVECQHFDYLMNGEVRGLINDYIQKN